MESEGTDSRSLLSYGVKVRACPNQLKYLIDRTKSESVMDDDLRLEARSWFNS